MTPERPIFAGTFHKTGTVLMAGIFRELAKRLDLVFWQPKPFVWKQEAPIEAGFHWDICADGNSRFLSRKDFFRGDVRCVLCIRDPRDVVISSAAYHVKAAERWLQVPREEFGGKTYQQAICAIEDEDERLVFEMDNAAGNTIRRMLAIDWSDERIYVTRLDRLIVDYELAEYRRAFTFLGFGGDALDTCLNVARAKSIFTRTALPPHVRHVAPAVWRERFTPALAAAFEERFPGADERLGYEPTSTVHPAIDAA